MTEADRRRYVSLLRFKSRAEIETELKIVKVQIAQRVSTELPGDLYFKRLALEESLYYLDPNNFQN